MSAVAHGTDTFEAIMAGFDYTPPCEFPVHKGHLPAFCYAKKTKAVPCQCIVGRLTPICERCVEVYVTNARGIQCRHCGAVTFDRWTTFTTLVPMGGGR